MKLILTGLISANSSPIPFIYQQGYGVMRHTWKSGLYMILVTVNVKILSIHNSPMKIDLMHFIFVLVIRWRMLLMNGSFLNWQVKAFSVKLHLRYYCFDIRNWYIIVTKCLGRKIVMVHTQNVIKWNLPANANNGRSLNGQIKAGNKDEEAYK